MKGTKKRIHKKKILLIVCIVFLAILLGLGGYSLYGQYQLKQLETLNFEDMLAYTTKNNRDAVITVGILRNGNMEYEVYGENSKKLPSTEHRYEIGSITKTFTTSLLCKAISDEKISLDDSIDQYLGLETQKYYPTICRLVTHTAGYKEFYYESPMIANFFGGQNSFKGISEEMLIKRIEKVKLDDVDYPFGYSNFGFAALGAVLERIYDKDYTTLINEYISDGLKLQNTRISDGSGNFDSYWEWQKSDAYMPAGALTSDITDMMQYTKLHMGGDLDYLNMAHDALFEANATTDSYQQLGIRIDAVGVGWMLDKENDIVWHNGATSNFNGYLGFDKESQIGVVILSNLPPDYRIPATVMGVELLISLQGRF